MGKKRHRRHSDGGSSSSMIRAGSSLVGQHPQRQQRGLQGGNRNGVIVSSLTEPTTTTMNRSSLEPAVVAAADTTTLLSSSKQKRRLPEIEFVHASCGSGGRKRPYLFGSGRNNNDNNHNKPSKDSGAADPVTESTDNHHNVTSTTTSSSATKSPLRSDVSDIDALFFNKITTTTTTTTTTKLDYSEAQQQQPPQQQTSRRLVWSMDDVINDKPGNRPRANSTDVELGLPQRGLCEERQILEYYRWPSQTTTADRPKGFTNLGNTCFLNSTLQCLAYVPPFSQYLLHMSDTLQVQQQQQHQQQQQQQHQQQNKTSNKQYSCNKNGIKQNQGKKFTLILQNLFRRVHSRGGDTGGIQKSSGSFVPSRMVEALPLLSTATGGGNTRSYKFRPGRQEDAHEFLIHLLDAMNHGELVQAGINPNASGWRDRLPIPRLDETTFVHRVFGGYLRSQVHCTLCGYNSNTYDPFFDLALEVSQKSCRSLQAALAEFSKQETLDAKNKWKCSGCKQHVCATKQMTVFRPPLTLCIPLKRFTYNIAHTHGSSGFGHGRFGGSGGGRKITKPIHFPADLKLSLSDGRSCAYHLTGAVIHLGSSATSGHYTAYIKTPQQTWFHMDDSFVEPVSEHTVLQQENAYLLFYSRKEVKLNFPPPPLYHSKEFLQSNHQDDEEDEDEDKQVTYNKKKPSKHNKDPSQQQLQSPSIPCDLPQPVETNNKKQTEESSCSWGDDRKSNNNMSPNDIDKKRSPNQTNESRQVEENKDERSSRSSSPNKGRDGKDNDITPHPKNLSASKTQNKHEGNEYESNSFSSEEEGSSGESSDDENNSPNKKKSKQSPPAADSTPKHKGDKDESSSSSSEEEGSRESSDEYENSPNKKKSKQSPLAADSTPKHKGDKDESSSSSSKEEGSSESSDEDDNSSNKEKSKQSPPAADSTPKHKGDKDESSSSSSEEEGSGESSDEYENSPIKKKSKQSPPAADSTPKHKGDKDESSSSSSEEGSEESSDEDGNSPNKKKPKQSLADSTPKHMGDKDESSSLSSEDGSEESSDEDDSSPNKKKPKQSPPAADSTPKHKGDKDKSSSSSSEEGSEESSNEDDSPNKKGGNDDDDESSSSSEEGSGESSDDDDSPNKKSPAKTNKPTTEDQQAVFGPVNVTNKNNEEEDSSSDSESSSSSSTGSSIEKEEDNKKEESSQEKLPLPKADLLSINKKPAAEPVRTKVIVDRGPGREKVIRMVGGPKAKPWRPKLQQQNGSLDLLGNRATDGWGNDDDDAPPKKEHERKQVMGRLARSEKSSKRKLYVDSWDAKLDEGRKKKVKSEGQRQRVAMPNNRFEERILVGVKHMKNNHHRRKGYR